MGSTAGHPSLALGQACATRKRVRSYEDRLPIMTTYDPLDLYYELTPKVDVSVGYQRECVKSIRSPASTVT